MKGWRQKRCKQTLRMQLLFQTLCNEIPQKATRHIRSNAKRTSKARDQNKALIPFYIKKSWKEDISNNEQCNLCSYRENTEGKDTLVKDLGKKSQFSHTLKLARLCHWQLAPIGATLIRILCGNTIEYRYNHRYRDVVEIILHFINKIMTAISLQT